MITIENINNLRGIRYKDRFCSGVVETKVTPSFVSEERYSFHFPAVGDGYKFNEKHDVHLHRKRNEYGFYEMFVMGLKSETRLQLSKDDLRNENIVKHHVIKAMRMAEDWYKTRA